MRVTGKIIDTTVDYKTGKPRLLLEVNEQSDFEILADEFSGKEKLSVEIKSYREKEALTPTLISLCWRTDWRKSWG